MLSGADMSNRMTRKKAQPKPARSAASARTHATRGSSSQPPTVSAWWLAGTIGGVAAAAAVCAWAAICLMFWQGSWQLLYHPTAEVTRTPASVRVPFDAVSFGTTEAGVSRLKGWWIPAAPDARLSHLTALYLHGAHGNLGDSVDALAALHAVGVNVLAFDYRGYGQSQFVHPSEARWREDADGALEYLTGTRHIPANSIVLVGNELGASLALEVAAAHPELAGGVFEEPREAPAEIIFRDPRARMVPAHWLVSDRWNLNAPAAGLRIPSLWLYWTVTPGGEGESDEPGIFRRVTAPKRLAWLPSAGDRESAYSDALSRWLDDLPRKSN